MLGIIKGVVLIGLVAVCVMISAKDVMAAGSGTQADPWECGETGDNVKAYIKGSTLKIYGTGKMADYANDGMDKTTAPWKDASFSSVEINNGITYVGTYSFTGCSLESVSIADSVTEVMDQCFSHCSNLKKVKLPNNSNFTKIRNHTFYGCNQLTNIVIPNSVTIMYMYAFRECGLTSINIPRSVVELRSDNIFGFCNSLTSITFEDISSLSYLPSFIEGCNNLSNVVIKQAASASQIKSFIDAIKISGFCPNISTITVPGDYVADIAAAYPAITVKKYVPPVEKGVDDSKEKKKRAKKEKEEAEKEIEEASE